MKIAKKNTAKTRNFGKITVFTAFDENHGFRDFRDYLLSLDLMPEISHKISN